MALDRTLTQIRERSYLDVLDLTLVVVRGRPWRIGLAALAGIAPFVIFNTWLIKNTEAPEFLVCVLFILEIPWATAPLTIVLGAMMFGERRSVGQIAKTILRGLPAMILYQFIIRGLLSMTGIFYLVMPGRLAFLNEVILLEGGRFWATLKRCGTLSGQNGGSLISYWLAQLAFGTLFLICFMVGSEAIESALTSSELTWEPPDETLLVTLKFQCVLWLIVAFFTVTRFLSYIDQRIRLEGWEVKIRLQSVGRAMEEGERW